MGNKGLLVLIDDDTDDHEILKMAVDELDRPPECLFFSDCESAIAHFSKNAATAPSYVLIDLRLPRIDSDQCLEQLQSLRAFDEPQIVVYSSSISEEWRQRLSQIGVDDFIQKTDSLPVLVNKIQDLVGAG
jgi:DNA-binding NarL/FixJ family response regulator